MRKYCEGFLSKHWILFFFVSLAADVAWAGPFRFREVDPRESANAIVALMSYSAIPDLASSSLSINNAQTGSPAIAMTQFGGGFTVSKSTPVYLEGAAAYSRYDPKFIASNGTETREIPLKWNSGTIQGGAGWDFSVAKDWVFRPIFNFSVGMIFSDLEVGSALLANYVGLEDIDFLDGGSMTVGGLGGSLMVSHETHDEATGEDLDLQLRYSYIHLQTIGGSPSVSGYSDSYTSNIYYRWRAPIDDWKFLKKPFRYVFELSGSHYMGDQHEVLGFEYLGTIGLGVELDSSAYPVVITRTRLVGRYMFGDNVRGYSIGFACSF